MVPAVALKATCISKGMNTAPTPRFAPRPFPRPRPAAALTGITFAPQRSDAGDLHYGRGEAGTHAPGISQRQMLEVEINVLDKTTSSPSAIAPALPRANSWC